MRRAFLAIWLAAIALVSVSADAGPGSTHWTKWARRAWIPRDLGGTILRRYNIADVTSVTLGTTPRAGGTSPPAATWSGTLTPAQGLFLQIDGAGVRGTATFRWSENNGSTFPTTGVLTAATVPISTTRGTVTIAFPIGAYLTDNTYEATVASVADAYGSGDPLAQGTAGNQPLFKISCINGFACADWGTGAAGRKLQTGNIALGAFSIAAVIRGAASAKEPFVHSSDGGVNGAYIDSGASSISAYRSSVTSGWNVNPTTWIQDNTNKSIQVVYDGTHAGHKVFANGVAASVTSASSGDPGTASVSGPLIVGSATFNYRGVVAEVMVADRAWRDSEVANLAGYWKGAYGL